MGRTLTADDVFDAGDPARDRRRAVPVPSAGARRPARSARSSSCCTSNGERWRRSVLGEHRSEFPARRAGAVRRPDRDLQRRHDRQGAAVPARPATGVLSQRHLPRQRDAARRRHDQAARLRVLVPQPHRLRLRQPVRRDGDANTDSPSRPTSTSPSPTFTDDDLARFIGFYLDNAEFADGRRPARRADGAGRRDPPGAHAVGLHVRDGGACRWRSNRSRRSASSRTPTSASTSSCEPGTPSSATDRAGADASSLGGEELGHQVECRAGLLEVREMTALGHDVHDRRRI